MLLIVMNFKNKITGNASEPILKMFFYNPKFDFVIKKGLQEYRYTDHSIINQSIYTNITSLLRDYEFILPN